MCVYALTLTKLVWYFFIQKIMEDIVEMVSRERNIVCHN